MTASSGGPGGGHPGHDVGHVAGSAVPRMAAEDAADWHEPVHADRAEAMHAVRMLQTGGWVVPLHPGLPLRQDPLVVRLALVCHPATSEVIGEIRYLDPQPPHEPGG